MTERRLLTALREARVIVCAGTGGVGKTTVSAGLALEGARLGRRTLVLTIDPARRLADALGLEEIGSDPTPVDLGAAFTPAQSDGSTGSLAAMMLEAKPTFDALVGRFAPDAATRERILENRIYRHLSGALAGSAEYAAMIQVHDLIEGGQYDLIIVDTPPAAHALDFLRAPKRMREFLDSRFVRTLVHPAVSASRFGARVLGRGLERILALIDRIAGSGFIEDISEFMQALDGLSLGLDERSRSVEEFLLGPESRFILVCGGNVRANASALEFLDELDAFRVPLVSVVANRLRPWPLADPPNAADFDLERAGVAADAKLLSEAAGSPELGQAIVERLAEYAEVCAAQVRAVSSIESAARLRGIECLRVDELAGDVDRLEGLAEIGRMLTDRRAELGRPAQHE